MKTVKWVDWVDAKLDSMQPKAEEAEKQVKVASESIAAPRPAKRKVVDTEPEPSYNSITGTASEIELIFSAVADYAKYELNTSKVFFKDTLMFQTRMFR